jgi:hypothetical protein
VLTARRRAPLLRARGSLLATACRVSSSSLAARPISCSPACPLGSLSFNSQPCRRSHRLSSFIVASFTIESSNTSSSAQTLSHQLAPDFSSKSPSFCASARNLKSRVKTELTTWCSPSTRQKAQTSCVTQVQFVKIIQSKKRSSTIDYRRKEDPWMTSTGTRSRACDYRIELVRVR